MYDIEGKKPVYNYTFQHDYNLYVIYHPNGIIESVRGTYQNKTVGLKFKTDSAGIINYIKYLCFDVEIGPEVYFFQNGCVHRYFNYGFDKKDLDLKEQLIENKDTSGEMTEISFTSYYKKKQGLEITYDTTGQIAFVKVWE